MIVTFVLVICSVVLLYTSNYIQKVTKWDKPPAGPKIHPFFGNFPTLLSLDQISYRAFHALTKEFGPVVRLVMGLSNILVLGGYKEMKEAMNNELLDDRGVLPTASLIIFGSKTYDEISLFSRGKIPMNAKIHPVEKWRMLRRFILKSLRDLGFGKSASEEVILKESKTLIQSITKLVEDGNGEVNLEKSLNFAGLNIVWNLVAGQQFAYDDPKMKILVKLSGDLMSMGKDVFTKPFGFLPFLRFIPPFKQKFDYFYASMMSIKQFLNSAIEEHKTTFDADDPRDLIDMFLVKMKEEDQSGTFTQAQLVYNCMDLFIAGSETMNKSLLYALAVMIRYPEVQEKVQQELDKIDADYVTMKDKFSLPYVEATLNEVWRFCNVAPSAPPRVANEAVSLESITMPAGTLVLYNTYSVHMDEMYWGDPEVFRPERFIDEKKAYRQDERNLPFGIGRHRCLGETLARMENFLFFANLLKKFRFHKVGEFPPSLEPEGGFTFGPLPFTMKISVRR